MASKIPADKSMQQEYRAELRENLKTRRGILRAEKDIRKANAKRIGRLDRRAGILRGRLA